MTESMIEHLAIAKWNHRREHGKKFGIELVAWEDETEALRDEVRSEVRATLLAMRSPNNTMHKAMCAAYNSPCAIWLAGIDAALIWPPGSADIAGVPMAEV
ncbi:hypothetical protein [Afipia sp. DC4300-2b1]|uniref:hypothetical protein n=1 Tax=Afipia sp. DC4300-2b1 TaxID=2804672 RepID=UPI003CFB8F0B